MKKINYKSDFDFLLELKDCKGQPLDLLAFDWEAQLFTRSSPYTQKYRVAHIGGNVENCYPDNGKIHIVCNDHNLGVGQLRITLLSHLPNTIYPDGTQDICDPIALDIELVTGQGDCPTTAEISAIAPFIKGDKGDPFTYQDLTAEQKAELQRPALEAANIANAAAQKADAAATQAQTSARNADAAAQAAQTATDDANQAETQRQTAENARVNAEQSRQTAETARNNAEITRQTQEAARVEAEQQRATEFQGFQATIDAKQDKLTTTEDLAISQDNQLAITDHGARRQFIDMWNSAWNYGTGKIYGKYDPENAPDAEHPFMGNDVWMTYKEALVCYRESSGANYLYDYCHALSSARTFLPIKTSRGNWPDSSTFAFSGCVKLEILNFDGSVFVYVSKHSFFNCNKLREIRNGFCIIAKEGADELNLPNIENFTVKIRVGMNLSKASKVTYESIESIIVYAENTTSVTITVHPDVYAKLIGDTTNEAAAALTPEELAQWQAILTAAAEKNISFATPT